MHRVPSAAVLCVLLVASLAAPVGAAAGPSTMGENAVAACGDAVVETSTAGGETGPTDHGANVSVTTLVAPGATYDRLQNASALSTAVDDGVLVPARLDPQTTYTPNDVVANTSVAVHRFDLSGNATGLLDRLAAQDRESPTANFQALVGQDGIGLTYRGPTACPPDLVLDETVDRGALRVVPDRRNDVLYLLLDVDRAVFELGGDTASADRWVFGHHGVEFELTPESDVVEDSIEVEDSYEVVRPEAAFTEAGEDPTLVLDSAPNRSVGGLTTLAAGTVVTVQFRLEDGATWNRTTRVHTHPDNPAVYRHYHAAFDLSDVPEGTSFDVSVRANGTVVGETTGEVVTRSASVSLPAREQWDDGTVLVENVTLSHGGFVRVTAGGSWTLGHSDYLPPGTHRNVTIDVDTDDIPRLADAVKDSVVVFVHADSDRDRELDRQAPGTDRLYAVDGRVVSAEAPIALSTRTPSSTPTATPPSTPASPTGTTPATPTETPGTTPTPTPTGVPGFGAAVAVLALVAAAVLRGRRRR